MKMLVCMAAAAAYLSQVAPEWFCVVAGATWTILGFAYLWQGVEE